MGFWEVGVKKFATAPSVVRRWLCQQRPPPRNQGGGLIILVVPLWILRFIGGGLTGLSVVPSFRLPDEGELDGAMAAVRRN